MSRSAPVFLKNVLNESVCSHVHLPKDCRRPKESHEDCPCQRTMLLQASRVSKCSQVSSTRTLPWTTFEDYQTRDTPGCRKSDNSLNEGRGDYIIWCWTDNTTNCSTCYWLLLPKKQRPNKAIWRGNGIEMCFRNFITIHIIHAYMIPVLGTPIFHSYSYDTIEGEKKKTAKKRSNRPTRPLGRHMSYLKIYPPGD